MTLPPAPQPPSGISEGGIAGLPGAPSLLLRREAGRSATARRARAALAALLIAGACLSAPTSRATARPDGTAQATEHLRYRATWNGLPVANAELLIQPRDARAVYLNGRAETNEFLDLLWEMRDSFEATVTTDPPRPGVFMLRQRENGRRRETSIVHDGERAQLVGRKQRRGKKPRVATASVHGRLHDPASVAYLIRSLPDGLRAPETYQVFTGTKTYALTVAPAARDTIELAGSRWPARKYELSLELVPTDEKPGPQPKVQHAELWVSAGPERLPLRLTAPTLWGRVTVELVGRTPRQA